MTSIRELARGIHPLHRLRKNALFRAITRTVDPIVRARSPLLGRPIYLRLFANASLIADPLGQEQRIRETFTALITTLPRDAAPFWDIGANVGLFTWYCATLRADIPIVSFEPDGRNLECLRRTARAWRVAGHEIVPAAVSDAIGRARFYVDDISGATGTLEDGATAFNAVQYGVTSPVVEVETITIDSLIAAAHPAPSLIKIDVEQAELRVIRGGAKLLQEKQPIVMVETYGDRPSTFALLREYGYALFDSEKRERATADSVNILALPARIDHPLSGALSELGYPLDG
jgi:FkbM family methyltransferase